MTLRSWCASSIVAAIPILALALAPAVASPWAGDDSQAEVAVGPQDPEELEDQVKQIAAELRCPTCRSLSVLDSPSGMAQEMLSLIRDQLRAGKTHEEVTAYFVDRYGEWILLKPKASGLNWAVWLLPLALVLGGLLFVVMTARRWVERGRAQEETFLDG